MIDPELLERLKKTPPDFAVHFHSGYCDPCAWTSRMLRDLPAIIRALSAAQEWAEAKVRYEDHRDTLSARWRESREIGEEAAEYEKALGENLETAEDALLAEFPMKAGGG